MSWPRLRRTFTTMFLDSRKSVNARTFASGLFWYSVPVALYSIRLIFTGKLRQNRCSFLGNVAVAEGFAAPRGAVNHDGTVKDANHRIVVIHQVTTRDKLVPETTVGAFSRAADAKEQVSLAVMARYGRVQKQRPQRSGGKGVLDHE